MRPVLRPVPAILAALLLSVLAGCVNDATGPTPAADANPSAIGAGESASADTQESHR